jgi:hypothetical protein
LAAVYLTTAASVVLMSVVPAAAVVSRYTRYPTAPEDAVQDSTALDDVTEPTVNDPGVAGAAARAGAIPRARMTAATTEVARARDAPRRVDEPAAG